MRTSSDPEDGAATSGAPASRMDDRRWRLAAGAVVALALLLRLPSLGFGLDLEDPTRAVLNIHLDERAMVFEAAELLGGDWQPGTFLMRGTLPFYVAGLVDALVVGVAALASGEGWSDAVARYTHNPSLIFAVHRSLSTLAGVLTVWVVLRMLRREVGAACALIAGLFLACSHLHVHVSNLGLVDVPWVLFGTLALDRALRIAHSPERRHYLLAGLWIGLAGATKYPGALTGLCVVAAHLLARARLRREGRPAPSLGLVALTVATSVVVFLAWSPRLLVHPEEYVEAMQTQARILDIVERSSAYGYVLWRHVENTLWIGLGEPVVLLAAIGVVVGLRRGGAQRNVVLLALLLVPTALVAKDPAPRFATGLLTGAAMIAAVGATALVGRLPRPLAGLVVLLAAAPSLVRSLATDLVFTRPDTRPEMVAAMAARGIAPSDVIGIGHRGLPQVQGGPRPYVMLLTELQHGRLSVDDVLAAPPPWILRDLTSGVPDSVVWEPFRELVEREYEEVLRIDERNEPWPEPPPQGFYLVPRTYVPFARPWRVHRPGSALALYRRIAPERR